MTRSKLLVSALVAIPLAALLLAAVFLVPSGGLRFEPEAGEQRDYRIDLRMRMIEEGRTPPLSTDVMIMQSIMRYRVEETSPELKVHVTPRFMSLSDGWDSHSVSSARSGALRRGPGGDLLSDGFDLVIDPDTGDTELQAVNQQAWEKLQYRAGDQLQAQMRQQVITPAVARSIPAQQGATLPLEGFQGMPPLIVTVESVTDDDIVVGLRRDENQPVTSVPFINDDDLRARITDVSGRMRLSRDKGWIESMALVSDQQVVSSDKTVNVHAAVFIEAVEDPALGPLDYSLRPFAAATLLVEWPDRHKVKLPQTTDETHPLQVLNPPESPLANTATSFSTSRIKNRITLHLEPHLPKNQPLGRIIALEELTLRDKHGDVLDIPLVIETTAPDFMGNFSRDIRLSPLGWDSVELSRIDRIDARFRYQPITNPTPVKLPLTGTSSHIQDGQARASAIPTDKGWRIVLEGTNQQFFFIDNSSSFPGLSAQWSDEAYDGMPPSDRSILGRVSTPGSYQQQLMIKGQADHFSLLLYKDRPASEAGIQQVTFLPQHEYVANRDLPPHDKKFLHLPEVQSSQPLSLDSVAPEGAEQNFLDIKLPAGIGAACELTSETQDNTDLTLLWSPVREDRQMYRQTLGLAKDEKDMEEWQMITQVSRPAQSHDINVTTTLRCPGHPAWKTQPLEEGNPEPWLVDMQSITDGNIDPDEPAARFFSHHRFHGLRGQTLRPMLKNPDPHKRVGSWLRESVDRTMDDYMDDQGRVRFWGRVVSVQAIHFSGDPIKRTWHHHLEAY